jgi:mannose-6-phosphate isomerase-like protein (cupin superfamily)
MQAFELDELRAARLDAQKLYHEFLRVPALSVGLYSLPAGGVDPQSPHTEDEVYYVVKGRAQITVGDETRPVQAGSTVYVAANVEHRFHDIVEDLDIIVFFAPAEYSLRAQPGDTTE